MSTPQFVDINNDGIKDILTGSYLVSGDDDAGHFHVLAGTKDGRFNAPVVLKGTDERPLSVSGVESACTRPFAVDWDGDGDLDLVVGDFAGTFHLFRGEGAGKFNPKPAKIMAGAKAMRVPYHGDPVVVDWDGDGDLDIVSGSAEGGVRLAENIAGRGKEPELSLFTELIPDATKEDVKFGDAAVVAPGRDTRVWVADYNGDGKLDLLVGDTCKIAHPVNGLNLEEVKKRYAEWSKKRQELTAKLVAISEDQEDLAGRALEELEAHRETQSQFMTEELTGFVWLFLRK